MFIPCWQAIVLQRTGFHRYYKLHILCKFYTEAEKEYNYRFEQYTIISIEKEVVEVD